MPLDAGSTTVSVMAVASAASTADTATPQSRDTGLCRQRLAGSDRTTRREDWLVSPRKRQVIEIDPHEGSSAFHVAL